MTDQIKQVHTDSNNPGVPTKEPAENRRTSAGQLEERAQAKPPKPEPPRNHVESDAEEQKKWSGGNQ
jgi:hypothetical protein